MSDPDEIGNQVEEFGAALPESAQNLLLDQLESITTESTAGLGVGAVLGLLTALWTTSSAVKHLIAATNAAYQEEEDRNFFKLRGLALGLTVGAVVFFGASIFVVAALPAVLADTALGDATRIVLSLVRWPGLAIAMMLALGSFYRLAPNRDDPRWHWTSPGTVVAVLLWIIASIGFSIYTANFGSYNETYGSMGAVIVLMLWLFITAFVVIVGAEINSEAERQTKVDTTQGRPEPMGRRDAHAADSIGATAQDG
ncbi:MAG: YihY/virulence factor BrkB family protein [Acidimicrobiales bacterium]